MGKLKYILHLLAMFSPKWCVQDKSSQVSIFYEQWGTVSVLHIQWISYFMSIFEGPWIWVLNVATIILIYVCIYKSDCVCVCARACTCIYAHTHTRTHAYTCTNITGVMNIFTEIFSKDCEGAVFVFLTCHLLTLTWQRHKIWSYVPGEVTMWLMHPWLVWLMWVACNK
jgi:hypothetical protein